LNPRKSVHKGHDFEQHAAKYLISKGYEIVQTNYRAGRQEIDIIARTNGTIVFVEVKASLTDKYGHPAEWVDKRKRDNLVKAAQKYIVDNQDRNNGYRFDLITFYRGKLEHYPDAFQADS